MPLNNRDKILTHLSANEPALKVLLSVLDSLPELALILSEEGEYLSIFGGEESLLVDTSHRLIGKNIKDVLPDDSASIILNTIKTAIQKQSNETLDYELNVISGLRRFEAAVIPVKDRFLGKRIVIWFARDITESFQTERNLRQMAHEDPLTKIPNRRPLESRIKEENARCQRLTKLSSIVLLDLDKFKLINDNYGHAEGDRTLKEIANLIQKRVRKSDFVCRLGGDEFLVILSLIGESEEEAHQNTNKWCTNTEIQFRQLKLCQELTMSYGIEFLPKSYLDIDELMSKIDMKMYQHKLRKE